MMEHQVLDLVDKHLLLVMPDVQTYTRKLLLRSLGSDASLKGSATGGSPPDEAGTPSNSALAKLGLAGLASLPKNAGYTPLMNQRESTQTTLLTVTDSDAEEFNSSAGLMSGQNPIKQQQRKHSASKKFRGLERSESVSLAAGGSLLSEMTEDMKGSNVEALATRLQMKGIAYRAFCVLFNCLKFLREVEEPARSGCLSGFLSGPVRMISMIVILMNAIEAACAADYAFQHGEDAETPLMSQAELFFLVFYSMELMFSLWVHGLYFFVNENKWWNIFDTLIIVQSTYERVSRMTGLNSSGNLSFMRVLRILRVVKALRILKFVKMFGQLRLMIDSIMNSFNSLNVMMFTLIFIFYMFSLVIMQGATSLVANEPSPEEDHLMHQYFGSVTTTCSSLFMCFIGGDKFADLYYGMVAMGGVYEVVFMMFTVMTNVVVVNIMTGMLLENVLKLAEPDPDQLAMEWSKKRLVAHEEITRLCQQMDKDRSGTITWSEFQHYVQEPRVASLLASLELDVNHAEMFYKTLCCLTNKDEVSIEQFVEGCVRMKGTASSIDLHILSVQVQALSRNITEMQSTLEGDDDAASDEPPTATANSERDVSRPLSSA